MMKADEKKTKECQGDPHELICEDINNWMKAMFVWSLEVTHEFTVLGGGGPTGVSDPPPPPFE